jgi:hypothetical protein
LTGSRIGCADKVGKPAVAQVQRAGRDLLGSTCAHDHHVDIDTVLLEPAEFGRDVFRPLQRAVAHESFDNLGLCLNRRDVTGERND